MATLKEPTRLADVPSFLCRIRPPNGAPGVEWAEFYERSSEIYRRVAQTDPEQYVTAMAVSCLDFDKAAEIRNEVTNRPQ
jgi:hypothetical protein